MQVKGEGQTSALHGDRVEYLSLYLDLYLYPQTMAEVTPTVSIAGKLTKADAKKLIEEAGGRPFALVAPAVTEIEGWDGTTFKDTSAFNGCKNLVSVSLPAATSIGKHAFENCTGLTLSLIHI